jgi:hypothetical protein
MKTITRVYDTYGQARAAVRDLEAERLATSEVSLIANRYVSEEYVGDEVPAVSKPAAGAGIGAALGGGAGLLAGLGVIAIPGLGPVVAAGWLSAAALGAVAGAAAGGIIGALVEAGEPEEVAHVYAEAVRRGGTLVTVRVADADVDRARAVLERHAPIDPKLRAEEYRSGGWQRFDPNADPYKPTREEIDRIRAQYLI